jgi:hypothetical protein
MLSGGIEGCEVMEDCQQERKWRASRSIIIMLLGGFNPWQPGKKLAAQILRRGDGSPGSSVKRDNLAPVEGRSQEAEVRRQESGVRSQESGGRSQESGGRSQEAGVRRPKSGGRSQESGVRSRGWLKSGFWLLSPSKCPDQVLIKIKVSCLALLL